MFTSLSGCPMKRIHWPRQKTGISGHIPYSIYLNIWGHQSLTEIWKYTHTHTHMHTFLQPTSRVYLQQHGTVPSTHSLPTEKLSLRFSVCKLHSLSQALAQPWTRHPGVQWGFNDLSILQTMVDRSRRIGIPDFALHTEKILQSFLRDSSQGCSQEQFSFFFFF